LVGYSAWGDFEALERLLVTLLCDGREYDNTGTVSDSRNVVLSNLSDNLTLWCIMEIGRFCGVCDFCVEHGACELAICSMKAEQNKHPPEGLYEDGFV
jgi:hypothetical protein